MDGVPRARLDPLPHAAFLILVGAATVSLLTSYAAACAYTLGLTAALAALYTAGSVCWDRLGRWRSGWLVALVAVWLALVVVAPGSLPQAYAWCAVPLTCVALRAMPPGRAVAVVAGFTAALLLTVQWRTGLGRLDATVAPIVALWTTAALYHRQQRDAVRRQRLIEGLRRTREELARQQREAGALAERARIAGELHDALVQELAGSRMLLQAADRDWPHAPETARERVRAVAEALGAHLVETRQLLADLTPPALEHGDLDAALRNLCSRAERAGAAAAVRYEAAGHESRAALSPEVATTLFRVAQEAVANARDHAGAAAIVVTLEHAADRVVLRVRDDGDGFDGDGVPGAPGRGFGLPAMRERLQARGGALTVDSAPGRGTSLVAALPLGTALPSGPRTPVAVAA